MATNFRSLLFSDSEGIEVLCFSLFKGTFCSLVYFACYYNWIVYLKIFLKKKKKRKRQNKNNLFLPRIVK